MTRPLVVTADAHLIYDKVRRGIAKTAIGLYRALAMARPSWQFVLFYRDGVNDDPFADLSNVIPRQIDMRGDRFKSWGRLRVPLGNLAWQADVFHTPAGLPPLIPMAKTVVTLHDLIPIDSGPPTAEGAAWGRRVARAAPASRAVITASEHAKGRIVKLCRVPPHKVTVTHWGPLSAPPTPPTVAETARVVATYGFPGRAGYVLHFGLTDPRKNTARLLAAWARLPHNVRTTYGLVVVGVQTADVPMWAGKAAEHGVSDSVRIHAYAPEADVTALVGGATVLAYPTLYEGFGLPLLDGFAAKVPVLTGNATSLPEVAGNAAELVDATSVDAIAQGLTRLLTDANRRAELVRRGASRLDRFTWDKSAEIVAGVFERVARSSGTF